MEQNRILPFLILALFCLLGATNCSVLSQHSIPTIGLVSSPVNVDWEQINNIPRINSAVTNVDPVFSYGYDYIPETQIGNVLGGFGQIANWQ